MIKEKKLFLDIGNSRIKWALAGPTLGEVSAFSYGKEKPDLVAEKLWQNIKKPSSVTFVSVAGDEFTDGLAHWFKEQWGVNGRRLISSAQCFGVKNGYQQPERLGADRWVAMIAAFHRVGGSVMVLDCGTAITLDAITETGTHLGGVIFPGPELMWEAFFNRTSARRQSGFSPDAGLFGKNTEQALGGGVLMAARGGIHHLIQSMGKVLGANTPVLVTGGGAKQVIQGEGMIWCPDLVIEGVALIGDQ